MKRASELLTDQDRSAVNRAVAEAEGATSAELVPVVATSSGRYDRAEDIVGLWLGAVGAIVVWFAFPNAQTDPDAWGGIDPTWKLVAMVCALAVGFLAGATIASRVGGLRRLFTPRSHMRDEVARKARAMFFDSRIHHTAGATGMLIYVSLHERMAAMLADDAIIEKLGPDAIDELCRQLTASLRVGNIVTAISETLKAAGERIGAVLPRQADDVDELPDALVIVD